MTLDRLDKLTRWMVYQHFRESGKAPTPTVLSRLVEAPVDETRGALQRLHEARALVLGEDGNVLMAHPFAAQPQGYRVRVADKVYEANCAWDALAIPPLLGRDGRIEATCPVWSDPLRLQIENGRLRATTSAIHFLVPARRFWEDIAFT
jgi:hypothetical protein